MATLMPDRKWLALSLLLLALAARTWGIFDNSLWLDDAWSLAVSTGHSMDIRFEGMPPEDSYGNPEGPVPASYFLQYLEMRPEAGPWTVANYTYLQESHPPLYFVVLHLWMRVFGATLSSARVLAIVISLATLPLLFGFARQIAGETAAWIAVLLFALSPIHSAMALQVRMYTAVSLLIVWTFWLTWQILDQGATPARVRLLIWLGITGLLLHYYFVLFLFVEGVALLTQRKLWPAAVSIGAAWTVLLAALAVYARHQISTGRANLDL